MNRKAWKSIVGGCALAAVSSLLAGQSLADGAVTTVGDFSLIDHQGTQYQLTRLGANKAVVIITQANSCAENIELLPRYKVLRTTWEKQGVKFLMMNSAKDDNLQSIRRMASTYDIDFPILLDESQLVAEDLNVNKAGEVLVLDPNTHQLLYRGPLDRPVRQTPDGGDSGDAASAASKKAPPPLLAEVLGKAVAGNVKGAETINVENAKGCALSFPVKDMQAKNPPDYATDVAPILKENCAGCHVQGGIGPFAMDSYKIVHGFAPMIREVLLTKRMPPAQVDPHVSHFQNANYISNSQLQTLVHWVDAGAPRGESKDDPLQSVKPIESEWQLGPPDMIVDVPAYEVPPTGVIDYFNHVIDLPFDSDKYVRAVQFIPGDKRVLHHLLSYISTPDFDRSKAASEENVRDFLEGYAPGKTDATVFPKDTGVFIPKGYKLIMQMHYTTMGKAVTDKTRVGLYFSKTTPKYKYLTYPISNVGTPLAIPAGENDHRMNSQHVFEKDTMVYALRPHMHYRGKAFRFKVIYPDQSSEILMNVPDYNFAWQPTYRLSQPKFLPAGSRIVTDGVYDNSKYNRGNPDPTSMAVGGPQSWHEMFIGYVTYTEPNNKGSSKNAKAVKETKEIKERTASR